MRECDEEQLYLPRSRLVLHFIYCSIFLIFCLSLVATDRWTDREHFTEYLTNVATMVSLVLGLVAIFYSFVSNAGLSQSLGNISRVADEITATRAALGQVAGEAREIVAKSEDNATELRRVSGEVSEHIERLEGTLKALQEESSTIRDTLAPIPARIDKISAALEAPRSAASEPHVIPAASTETGRKSFIELSSITGLVIAYAIHYAYEHKKELNWDELAPLMFADAPYLQAFGIALHAVGWISAITDPPTSRTLRVQSMSPFLNDIAPEHVIAEMKRRKMDPATIAHVEETLPKLTEKLAELTFTK